VVDSTVQDRSMLIMYKTPQMVRWYSKDRQAAMSKPQETTEQYKTLWILYTIGHCKMYTITKFVKKCFCLWAIIFNPAGCMV